MTLSIRFLDGFKRLFCLLTLPLLFSVSLYGASTNDDAKIKKVIISYNFMLIDAAKDPDFLRKFEDKKKFEKYANERVAQKLFIWIKSWQENNLYMDAKLLDISFGKVVKKGNEAEVLTDEVWVYKYFRVIGKNETKEAYPPAKKYYKVKYTLKKSRGEWKIAKIDVFYEKEHKL